MPYEVLTDGATIQIFDGMSKTRDDEDFYETHGRICMTGDIIADEEISPVHVKLYDAGDEHIKSLIKRIRKGAKSGEDDSTKE